MPRIYVEFNGLSQMENRCKTIASKVDGIKSDMQKTVSHLDWDIRYASNINNTASQLARKLDSYANTLKSYQQFITEAQSEYKKLDEYEKPGLLDNISFAQIPGINVIVGPGGEKPFGFTWSDFQKFAKSLLNSYGLVGKTLGIVTEPMANWLKYGNIFDPNDGSIKSLLKCAKNVVKGAGIISPVTTLVHKTELISRFKNTGNNYLFGSQHNEYLIKNLFGLNKLGKEGFRKFLGDEAVLSGGTKWLPNNIASGFKTSLKSRFIKSNGKINGLGIASVVLDAGLRWLDNKADVDAGRITTDRAVVETAAETAFDIALTAGATSLVSAGLVAAGAVWAPAIAVAAGAGLLVTGANILTEKLTGDSLTHHFGSFIGDVWDGSKEAIKSLGDWLSMNVNAKISYSSLKPAWI